MLERDRQELLVGYMETYIYSVDGDTFVIIISIYMISLIVPTH
jgi:hypothetical protein